MAKVQEAGAAQLATSRKGAAAPVKLDMEKEKLRDEVRIEYERWWWSQYSSPHIGLAALRARPEVSCVLVCSWLVVTVI
jgi:hypothetical protein